jgi:outer membrane lipoprotein SlyB
MPDQERLLRARAGAGYSGPRAVGGSTLQRSILPACFIMLSGIAGCAPAKPPPPAAVQPASVSTGTILSMRAVAARASQDPLRAAMLTTGASPNDSSRSVEFIVRTDDGATLSIVQTNEPGFRTGDRVVIMRDDLTHLARPGSQAGS